MSGDTSARPASTSRARTWALGCGGTLLLAALSIGLPVGFSQYQANQARIKALAAQEEHAAEVFDPVLEKMVPVKPAYDIDKTIRVLHEIDLALSRENSLEDYLKWAARQDYDGVAPEVLEQRRELLAILMQLYAKQAEAGDQQAMWEFSKELILSTFSVVSLSGEANLLAPAGTVSIDREQAKELLTELRNDQRQHKQLQRDIQGLEQDLFTRLMDYSTVYYKYLREWDELSVLRDRAYLAAHNGDWEAAISAAELAVQKAPDEREAHLMMAMALIEGGGPERQHEITDLLDRYIKDHPEASAPAMLLLGVHQARQGQTKEAQLSFQQSAAYFPKQATQLTEMVNPYKTRSFLRKSREGGFIVELYQSTMLGAGYFSPDLQMAKVLFDRGEKEAGRVKVLDHFARRRNQQQWDFILSDLRFCHDLLGPEFWQIFPETTWLDLEVSPAMFGSAINLSVRNRSARPLHNATLVLALHFTDMYPEDYVALPAQQTVPAVLANKSTSFGSVTIDVDVMGTKKGVSDIVTHRAILVTNDAVMWVDTDQYKIAESEEFRNRNRLPAAGGKQSAARHPLVERHPDFQDTVDTVVGTAASKAKLEIEPKYGKDAVLIKLPRELSILRPLFRLKYGDQVFSADDNVIEGDHISLRFKGVDNFDATGFVPGSDLELLMASPFGDVVMSWKPDGALTWRLAATKDNR